MKPSMPFVFQLFKFVSYTARMRLVCGIGFLFVILLLFLTFYIQYPLVNLYQHKLNGIKQSRVLIDLLEKTGQSEMLIGNAHSQSSLKLPIEMNILAVDQLLGKIQKQMEDQNNHHFLQNPGVKHQLNLLIDTLRIQWQEIVTLLNGGQKPTLALFEKLSHDIVEALSYSNQVYGLDLEIDFKDYFISDVMLLHLPATLTLMAEIEAKRLNSSQRESRELSIKSVKREIKVIQLEIAAANENQFDAQNENVDGFHTYKNAVLDYLEGQISPESITKVFLTGWGLENSMMTQLEQSQQTALDTLYFRQNSTAIISALLILAFILIYFTRIIRNPLDTLKTAVQDLSEGDLSVYVPVTSKDEVAEITRSFNGMAERWKKNIEEAQTIVEGLVDFSTSIFDAAKRFDANISSQEKIMTEIQRHVQKIASMSLNYSDLLHQVKKGIGASSASVTQGTTSLTDMEYIMKQMIQASKQIVSALDTIRKQVNQINPVIVSVISLADQSNLLSLNTAIKASRTGVSGKGFVVVAEKIKELADQTAVATLDLEQNVQEIISKVSNAVDDVDKFSLEMIAYVNDEKNVNDQLKVRLKQTLDQLNSFESMNDGMQSLFIESQQIVELIMHFSEATEKTNKSGHKMYRDAESLLKSSQNLRKGLDFFKRH